MKRAQAGAVALGAVSGSDVEVLMLLGRPGTGELKNQIRSLRPWETSEPAAICS